MKDEKHITVFEEEGADLLNIETGRAYADLTLGGGGHSLKILKSLQNGTLICFDVDKIAIKEFENILKNNLAVKKINEEDRVSSFNFSTNRIYLVNDNFENIKKYLDKFEIDEVDGVLVDLGWQSEQLDTVSGLSHQRQNDVLDMRLDQSLGVTAADLLNALGRNELKKMFEEYSDIYGRRNARLVNKIVDRRQQSLFKKVSDLLKVINSAFPAGMKGDSQKFNPYYPKVFQALRIAVNQELSTLQNTLPIVFENLGNNGRFLIITFHSGEEKIVRKYFKKLRTAGRAEFITMVNGKNYIQPSISELERNLRSRSAKLWGIEKASSYEK